MRIRGIQYDNASRMLQFVIPIALLGLLLGLSPWAQRVAIVNTIALGFGANLIAIPVGVLLARACTYSGWIPFFARITCLSFLFVPLFVHVSSWDSAIGKLGWLTNASWSINTIPAGTWMIAIWIHGLAAVPCVCVVSWFGMSGSIRIHEEQAILDTSERSVFWHVTLPRLMPLIGVCAVWVFVTCAREITVTDIYRVGTLAEQIYLGYSLGDSAALLGPGFSMSAIAIIGSLIVAFIVPYLSTILSSSEQFSKLRISRKFTFGQSATIVAILVVLVIVPAINLIARASRFVENIDQTPVARNSIANFVKVVSQVPEVFASEIYWSTLIASASSAVILVTSSCLVWFSLQSRAWKIVLLTIFVASCSLPGPVIGSLVLWLRSIGNFDFVTWLFDRTIFAPVLANVIYCFPISLILVWFAHKNSATDVLEHATLEGANKFNKWFHFAVLGNIKSLLGIGIIVFANSFGELSASQLTVPPGMDTVPRRMLGMLHSGVNDHTAGLTIVSVLFTISVVAIGYGIVHWHRRKNEQ